MKRRLLRWLRRTRRRPVCLVRRHRWVVYKVGKAEALVVCLRCFSGADSVPLVTLVDQASGSPDPVDLALALTAAVLLAEPVVLVLAREADGETALQLAKLLARSLGESPEAQWARLGELALEAQGSRL